MGQRCLGPSAEQITNIRFFRAQISSGSFDDGSIEVTSEGGVFAVCKQEIVNFGHGRLSLFRSVIPSKPTLGIGVASVALIFVGLARSY